MKLIILIVNLISLQVTASEKLKFSQVNTSKTTLPSKILTYQSKPLQAKDYDQFYFTSEEAEKAFRLVAGLAMQSNNQNNNDLTTKSKSN